MTQPAFAQIAPINRRAIGYLIDAAIAAGLAVVLYGGLVAAVSLSGGIEAGLTTLIIGGPIVSLVLLGWFVVYTMMQAGTGSIGMRSQGLRLASATDGSPLGFGRALLRNVIFGLAAGIVVGYFTPLFDGSGRFQGWHDRVANALVLDARLSPAPARESADRVAAADPVAPPVPVGSGAPAIPGVPAPPIAGGFTPPSASAASAAPAAAPVKVTASEPATSAFSVPSYTPPAPTPPAPSAFGAPDVPPRPPAPAAYADAAPPADDGSLIAFVPGVTQPGRPAPAVVNPSTETPVAAPMFASEPVAEPVFDLDPALDETLVQRPSASPAAAAEPAPEAAVESPGAPAPAPAPALRPVPAMPISAPEAPVSEAPVAEAPVAEAPVAEAPAPTTPAFGVGFDDDAELEQTRISVPGHRLIFTWDDGTRVPVSRRTIFGRNPAPEDGAVIVPVRDETLSLSKTHFEAASESSGGWVLDRHSTNGMTIVRDGQRFACPAGQRVPVRLGDAIEIGDRIVTVGGYA